MKNKTLALLLSIFLGGIGIDRFYLGYIGMGLLKLFTGGFCGILYILDIINIATGRLGPADGSLYEEDMNYISGPAQPSAYTELESLARLHDQGILNDQEFENKKAEILRRM